MSGTTMAFLIVAVVILGSIISEHLKKQRLQHSNGLDDKSEGRIRELEERVAVLEKLATDKRVRLADEIDSL
ncbi:hypothetical protein QGN29_09250 [Temperatibacter marinus]|uniref:Phage shock protein B n=1 Tax=Temperatibacter marinus TaxID=1456591 RepID=A0AA52EG71_9PROT|nr:hypothetical protein [Temperatibacter marinus]WND01739.1 hypothetical protein QGN29_09250 [Temperatibacter marinus]